MHKDPIEQWLSGLKQGESLATEAIWKQYFEKLVRLARTKLHGMPGRSFDEEDIALSAMNSFFKGAQAGKFPKLDDHQDLWRLLVTITARKAIKRQRRAFAAKRGGGNVRGESVFIPAGDAAEGPGIGGVLGTEPTPELAAQMAETCQDMLEVLDDEVLQEIAQFKLKGFTNEEIAQRLDCTTRTVERKLERIRRKWTNTDQ